MQGEGPFREYTDLAAKVFDRRVAEQDVPGLAAYLPSLDQTLLEHLARHAEKVGITAPRHGWAIAYVACAAAVQQPCDAFTRTLSYWHLGHAANEWGQPRRVAAAIASARKGFAIINEPGWVAACDWQLNALSWTKPDIAHAAAVLERARAGLRDAGMTAFVAPCQLALAYAQILIGALEKARENIHSCEAQFAAQGDPLNQARCWLNEASLLRRQNLFDDAFKKLKKGLAVFLEQDSPLDAAKAHAQIGLLYLYRTDDLSLVISHLTKAAQAFETYDLDLWQAACVTNLGALYLQNGQLARAEACHRQAGKIFRKHRVLGLLADNLNDSGKLNTLRGFPMLAVRQFERAEALHEKVGARLPAAIDLANLGEAYGQIGRYQDALDCLERAAALLAALQNSLRQGSCAKYTASIWTRLGQTHLAHAYLEQAEGFFTESSQKALLASIHNERAKIFFEQGQLENAVASLERALEIARRHGVHPQAALAERLLGEALLNAGQREAAQEHLQTARAASAEMGMNMEQAACLVAQGAYFIQTAAYEQADAALAEALRISAGAFPEVDWRAYIGLADLADARGDDPARVDAYQRSMATLARIRHNFWQPVLAGSYLHSLSVVFDRAMGFFASIGASLEALQFIEGNKATTLLTQISNVTPAPRGERSRTLVELKAEIGWLQERLRVSFDTTRPITSARKIQERQTELVGKVEQYDALLARLERRHGTGRTGGPQVPRFNLEQFRERAAARMGTTWVALDYYLTDEFVIVIEVGPDRCALHNTTLTERARLALRAIDSTRQTTEEVMAGDLRILGDLLVPSSITQSLTPETILLIAPHKQLHRVPWAALRPRGISGFLVQSCIPAVAPSLRSVCFLWEREGLAKGSEPGSGLVVGVSEFPRAKTGLPLVRREVDVLRSRLGKEGHFLAEQDATWKNLVGLVRDRKRGGLSRFSWLHIASHAFADARTGRLGGIALWDEDVWLDQLHDLAPLPMLVTISGCSALYSFLHEGDEHIGLPTTCMAVGANAVIGSHWPVVDEAATQFSIYLYEDQNVEKCPGKAVAQAQRKMISAGAPIAHWAGFSCLGIPQWKQT